MQLEKYEKRSFGRCPRTLCHGTPALPLGLSPDLAKATVKLFCPRCEDVYDPPKTGRSHRRRDMEFSEDEDEESDDGEEDRVVEDGESYPTYVHGTSGSALISAAGGGFQSKVAGVAGAASGMRAAAAAGSTLAGRTRSHDEMIRAETAARRGPFSLLAICSSTSPSQLDGAYFGPSFAHSLLMSKPELLQPKTLETYVPRIYGFRVHSQRGRLPLALGDSMGAYAAASVGRPGVRDATAAVAEAASSGSVGAGAGAASSSKPAAESGRRGSASRSAGPGKSGRAASAAAAGAGSAAAATAAVAAGSAAAPVSAAESSPTGTLATAGFSIPTYSTLVVEHNSSARAERSPGLTAPYPNGKRPADDDFTDDEDDVGTAGKKKRV
jgi:casein kinase II subunit beta